MLMNLSCKLIGKTETQRSLIIRHGITQFTWASCQTGPVMRPDAGNLHESQSWIFS